MSLRRLAPASLALLAACAADFTPRSVLEDVRVLALVAEPPELGPGESTAITAWTYAPPGASITPAWSFCPFSLGSSVAFACVAPACEVPLTPRADGAIEADPTALALQCLQALQQAGELPPGVPPQLPPVVEVIFRYRAMDATGAVAREAVQPVPVHTSVPPPGCPTWPSCRNHNPVILQVSIGGAAVAAGGSCSAVPPPATCPVLPPGGELEVAAALDPASAEGYLDPAGRPVVESLPVSFYTTAGRFDYDRALGPDARVKLKHERIAGGTAEALLWAVARDLRGGETVAGPFAVSIGW